MWYNECSSVNVYGGSPKNMENRGMAKYTRAIFAAFAAVILMACLAACSGSGKEDTPPSDKPVEVITFEDPVNEPEGGADDTVNENVIGPVNQGENREDTGDTATSEGDVAPEEEEKFDPGEHFFAEEINDEVFARMEGKSFPEGCTTKREDLRYLDLLYKDLDGNTHVGEMVCNKEIASKVIYIFKQLYEADYPIEKMVLVDEYDADDMASMMDNNTSCFNYRVVPGTTKISKHAMGLAIDLNPRYNPYIYTRGGEQHIEPDNGVDYVDRSKDFDYKIDKNDLAYRLFTEAGFTWGGSWTNSKDYQHFQM